MTENREQALDFIYRRRSVRTFQDTSVPDEIIHKIIDAAIHAPSGKNQQNWHFVVVRNQNVIQKMAQLVEQKHEKLLPHIHNPEKQKAFKSTVGYHTVFKKAPCVVLVYAGPYPVPADDMTPGDELSGQEIDLMKKVNPGVQNIAAAMQNLQLAAAMLGYGTCWMTGPTYADREISREIGFKKEGFNLAALTPLGIPASAGNSPPRKPLSEVVSFVD